MMKKLLFLAGIVWLPVLLPLRSLADTLQVSSDITPQQMVQEILVGGGVQTSNITFSGATISRGKFWGGPGNIGISEGIILTSGSINIALGPNNSGSAGAANPPPLPSDPGDPDLTLLAGVATKDACVLEFDFVPQSTVVSFKYVFGSEEYHEFVYASYNDAFGFFISGPGINGPYSNNSKNIALIPLTTIPVSIHTVNYGNPYGCQGCCQNCTYFVNNTQNFTQYDAFTTVLTAWANVIPCETYHIKLAIADGSDEIYDSGVFLEANSFSSVGVATSIEFSQPTSANFAIEGCNNASITFTLSTAPDSILNLPINILGTATNGVDYELINDYVTFPTGYTQVDVDIIPFEDNMSEWPETVIITYNSSLCGIDIDTVQVKIYDFGEMYVETTPDTTIGCGGEATVGVADLGGYDPYLIVWSTGDTSESITVNPLITTTYYVTVNALCDAVATDSVTVFVQGPEASAGADQSIPYGTSTILHGSASQGSGNYIYDWEPSSLLVDPTVPEPQTLQLQQTTVFSLLVTDESGGCQDLDDMVVFITGGPLAINPVASPAAICYGASSQLFSYVSGGSEDYTFSWTSDPPGFISDLPNPIVQPLVNTTYYLLVDDGYNVVSGNTTVEVIPLPVANAGTDDTIPHGTYTMLHGSASQGTGNYNYSWEPAAKLINPFAQNPVTVKLYETTLFRLSVQDASTGCSSSVQDLVTIVVSGGALGVDADVTDTLICLGETTQLHALGYGGNFPYYSYEWSSVPPGFYDTIPEPFITPTENMVYTVEIDDGYNTFQSSVEVRVSPPPQVDLGEDVMACPYDSVTLSLDLPGMSYYWSNGSISNFIRVGTTGLGFDVKKIWVEVGNENGCNATDTILVYFDYSQCFGVEEYENNVRIKVYPNPTTGWIQFEASGLEGRAEIRVTSVEGQQVVQRDLVIPPDGFIKGSLNLSDQPRGIYFLQFIDKKRVYSSKVTLK